MTVHNREGVAFAAGEGFSRVVLAREMPLAEIEGTGKDAEARVSASRSLSTVLSATATRASASSRRSSGDGAGTGGCAPSRAGNPTGSWSPKGRLRATEGSPGRARRGPLPPLDTRLAVYPHLDLLAAAGVAQDRGEDALGGVRRHGDEHLPACSRRHRRREAWSPSPEDMRDLALAFNRGFTAGYILGARDHGPRPSREPGYPARHGHRLRSPERGGDRASCRRRCPPPGDGLAFCDRPAANRTGAPGTPAVRDGRYDSASPRPWEREPGSS